MRTDKVTIGQPKVLYSTKLVEYANNATKEHCMPTMIKNGWKAKSIRTVNVPLGDWAATSSLRSTILQTKEVIHVLYFK